MFVTLKIVTAEIWDIIYNGPQIQSKAYRYVSCWKHFQVVKANSIYLSKATTLLLVLGIPATNRNSVPVPLFMNPEDLFIHSSPSFNEKIIHGRLLL